MSRNIGSVGRPTLTYRFYSGVANLVAPLAFRKIARKLEAAGVSPERVRERMGQATLPRPKGRLMWCHAASVGESLSALTLIDAMGKRHPDLEFLLTSGTATSAEIVARRMPPRCRHQFAPLDSGPALRRFLRHWQPDQVTFVESELWPQMIMRAAEVAPLALLNARISKGSLRNWGRFGKSARMLLDRFQLIRTQDQATLDGLLALGADQTRTSKGQNLKSAAGPLQVNQADLASLQAQIGDRPVWIAASTHPGEENAVLEAHQALLERHPELLLVLIPRHPERAPEITALAKAAAVTVRRRSLEETPDTEVYLADTLGEMGLFYALSPRVFLGGSLTPVGGHNPFEPAHAGAVVIHGPLYANFGEAYADYKIAGGQIEICNSAELANAIELLLDDPAHEAAEGAASKAFALSQMQGLDQLISELSQLLPDDSDG